MRRRLIGLALAVFAVGFFAGTRALLAVALALNVLVVAYLALVAIRRIVLTVAALGPRPPAPSPPAVRPRLTVLIPCRDEQDVLPATLAAWDRVDYPRNRLEVMFVDDASADQTGDLLRDFADARPWITNLRRDEALGGKGGALNDGLDAARDSDVVAVFDADARPEPDCLVQLVAALTPDAAAVAGRMLPVETPRFAGVFAAIEAAVHQRLTLTGAARLGGTVSLLGSAYLLRRGVLEEFRFTPGHRLEDIDLSARLLVGGRRITWAPAAMCHHLPARDAASLGTQRAAWARGYHRVMRDHGHALFITAPNLIASVDRLLFTAGYLDRLAFLAAVALAATASAVPSLWLPWWFVAAWAALPLAQIALALYADRWRGARLARVPVALALVAVDLAASTAAAAADVLNRPLPWRKTQRVAERKEAP
ncbi:MAG: glycosyltransferase family 2 protein [Candidatus Lernaella stagnicola]|nr:glycosyltransferase family 2 protein [Candidatus Lernaella stagnicola]